MSLGIVIKGPEGLVLAAESRVTLQVTPSAGGQATIVNFDNATKLLSFNDPNSAIGAVTYGQAVIGLRTAQSFVTEFEASLPQGRLSVADFAQQLSDFFVAQWNATPQPNYQGPDMIFVVAGFNQAEPYGHLYQFGIPSSPTLVEQQPNQHDFGLAWGGQREFVDRIIQGYDARLIDIVKATLGLQPNQVQALSAALAPLQMQVALQAMALQDCVDMAIFFIRTTIAAQELTVGLRGCGGPIDVATITRNEGLRFIQKKKIVGEAI